jgi:hypothetical protein
MARRGFIWSMVGVGAVGIILCGVAGAVLCEGALHPPRRAVPPNSSALTVQITAKDGAVLRAWLFEPTKPNRDAVLILHGIADSRASQIGLARMFLDHGYTVLTPDSRAHGESGGELATYGLLEAGDVHHWVSWLIEHQHPRRVFGIGESLGGAVLIEALAVEPRFSAIVADSAFSSFERIAKDRIAERLPVPQLVGRVLASPVVWSGFLYARLRYGLDLRAASPEKVLARSTTPVLLIHGLNDRQTPPVHSEILAASNRAFAALWLVPGAGHTGAYGAAPHEFESRVVNFFQNSPPGASLEK